MPNPTYTTNGISIGLLAWTEDGTASRHNSDSIRIINVIGHKGRINSAPFSPNSMHIATTSNDGTALIWDTKNGQVLATLQRHTETVNSASFSSDGSSIITASDDQTARLWDATSGQALTVDDGTPQLELQPSDLKELITYAKKLLPRWQLTCEERKQYFLKEVERCKK